MPGKRTFICDCPVLPLPTLTHEFIPVRALRLAEQTAWVDGVLHLAPLDPALVSNESLIVTAELDVIPPDARAVPTDTIMDVMPIAVKREGSLGAGVTRIAQDVVLLLTGRDAAGEQLGEFGHSAGMLPDRLDGNAPGTPSTGDWIVRLAITLRPGVGMQREGPLAAHRLADQVAASLRHALLAAPPEAVTSQQTFPSEPADGLRVVLVKEVMGQGAMHDNLVLPRQPGGVAGGRSIIDLGNAPLLLRPNELRDGALHSLCCVGPSTKETTLHYFHDPLLATLTADPQIDLCAVVVFGSAASEDDKRFVAERVGALVQALGADGVMLATEGFGNNHVDFALALHAIAVYGTPCVGVSWAARQGQLVAGNEAMVALVEVNHAADGTETRVLGENTARPADAHRAVSMLKSLISGIDILPAPSTWDAAVIAENTRLIAAESAFTGGLPSITTGLRSEIPVPRVQPGALARLAMPLSQARVALITASGAYLRGQAPFERAGDHSFREIPSNSKPEDVAFSAGGYDHSDVNRDPNCMLPLQRLHDLIAVGEVGSATEHHIGFQGGGGDLEQVRTTLAPGILARLQAMHADAVLLTGG